MSEPLSRQSSVWAPESSSQPATGQLHWEFHTVRLPRGTSRQAARQAFTDAAEYGHWELAVMRLFPDGRRVATLRRRTMRIKPAHSRPDVAAL